MTTTRVVLLLRAIVVHVTSLEQTVLGEELMATIAALRRLVRRRLRSAVPGPPLRGAHLELLEVIEKQPGIGIASAGRALHLAANSVSTLVNQLIDLVEDMIHGRRAFSFLAWRMISFGAWMRRFGMQRA